MQGESFLGEYSQNLKVLELPHDLSSDSLEESKGDAGEFKFAFNTETNRVVYQDEHITVYPVRATNSNNPN